MPAAITTFVDVDLTIATVPDRFSFASYMGVFDHGIGGAARYLGPYTSVAEVVAAGFTLVAEPEVYYWASSVFAQSRAVNEVYIGRIDAGDANMTATLDAILAATDAADVQWYGFTIESRVKAVITLAAAWAEANPRKLFIYQTADADVLTGAGGNIFDLNSVAGYRRSAGIYHATSSGAANGYLDGAWASNGFGMDLDAPNGRGIWAFNQLQGITYDPVTSAQASAIYADNGNLYGRNVGLSFTSKGVLADGAPYFIDVQTTADWIVARLEEDVMAAFVGASVIPYTDSGINTLIAVIKQRLDIGVVNGHFSPDFPTVVTAPLVKDISSATKATRELTVTASATFAGAVQKLLVDLTLVF